MMNKKKEICRGNHEPFINPITGKPSERIDNDGLIGEKGKIYYECYICNAYYDPDSLDEDKECDK